MHLDTPLLAIFSSYLMSVSCMGSSFRFFSYHQQYVFPPIRSPELSFSLISLFILCNHRNVAIDHDDANVCFPQVQVAVSTFFDALIACRQKSNTTADAWHAAVASAMLPLRCYLCSNLKFLQKDIPRIDTALSVTPA